MNYCKGGMVFCPPLSSLLKVEFLNRTDMKNRYIAALLAFFLGGLGVHKFYLGKWTGILYLVLCWTYIPSIIALVEGILYLVNGEDAFNEKYNKKAMAERNSNYVYDVNPLSSGRGTVRSNASADFVICPKCGHTNEAGSNFCESFGQKL